MKLSFCMIVKDEADRLERCLQSVRDVVDEMVVLDTGSSDRTPEIAQSFGAIVPTFKWCNDFSAARNHALQYVTGDWVLVLDADEILASAIVPALKQAIQSESHLVLNLLREEVGAAQSPYSMVSRLFRHHPAICFSRPYHAMIDDSVMALLAQEAHWQVGYLPEVAILHEGYQSDLIAARDKFNKARSTMEGFLAEHPQDAYVCSKLGALYVQLGETAKGLELLRRGLRSIHATGTANAVNDTLTLYELHYHLGSVYGESQQLDQAEHHYQAAVQQPIPPQLKLGALNNLGNVLKDRHNLQGARSHYEQALQIDPSFAIAHHNLGTTLKAMGQLGDAIAHYQQAIALKPDYADAHQNLGVALLKLGQVPESLAAFGRAIALHEQQGSEEGDRLRQGLQAMGFNLN
jgi:tetratricopeptide (TPR) repeat protein